MGGNLLENIKSAINFGNIPDAYTLINNLGANLPSLKAMLGSLAYLFAFIFAYVAILKLSRKGSGSNDEASYGGIIVIFISAVALAYLPSTMNTLSFTILGGSGDAFSYNPSGTVSDKMANALRVIYQFIGVVGVMAAIYGFFIWKSVSEGRSRDSYAKGTWHIIGGWFAVHLQDVINTFKDSVL